MAMDDKLSAALLNYRGAEKIHRANERGQVVDRFRRNQGAPGGVRGDLGPITIKGKVGLSEAEIWKRKMEIAKMLAEAKAAVILAKQKFGEQSLEFAKANNAVKVAQLQAVGQLSGDLGRASVTAQTERSKSIAEARKNLEGAIKYTPSLTEGLDAGFGDNVTAYGHLTGYSADELTSGMRTQNKEHLGNLDAVLAEINSFNDPDDSGGAQAYAKLEAFNDVLAGVGTDGATMKRVLMEISSDPHYSADQKAMARSSLNHITVMERGALNSENLHTKTLEREVANVKDVEERKWGPGQQGSMQWIMDASGDPEGSLKLLEAAKPADLDREDIDTLGAGLDNAQRGTPDRTMTMAQSKRIIMDSDTFKKYADAHRVPADELAFARFSREAKAKNKQNQKDKWQAKRAAPIGAAQPTSSEVSAAPSPTATLSSKSAQVRDSVADKLAGEMEVA
tara:strand:- start:44 stop:1396 length:1353 start_codon:yes stop_codon:yes gene_type:complete